MIQSWNNQGSRSPQLNDALKKLFFTTVELNVSLYFSYIPSQQNPADAPSRRLSSLDSTLTTTAWEIVQNLFGGNEGHTADLMALDSNVMQDKLGRSLPHFTPGPAPGSAGINLFAQDLPQHKDMMRRPYVFPPLVLVGLVFRFLQSYRQPCAFLVIDVSPRKYW